MSTEEAPRSAAGLSLGARIFLACAMLVALTVAAAVLLTTILGQRIAEREAGKQLTRYGAIQELLEARRFESLRLPALNLGADSTFVSYIAQALQSDDRLSMFDQLEERTVEIEADLAILFDLDGRLLADTSASGVGDAADFAADPLIAQALEEFESAGLWQHRDRLYNAVVVPLVVDDYVEAYLLTAFIIDDQIAEELERVGGAAATYFILADGQPRPTAGTLDSGAAERLATALVQQPALLDPQASHLDRQLHTDFAGSPWLTQVTPLLDSAGEPLGALTASVSLDQQLAPFRRIRNLLGLVGLASIALASLVSFFLSRRVLQPVRQLAVAARSAAEGDYDVELPAGSRDEVGQLAGSFRRLLAELREKRDMEAYVSELSRHLPQESELASSAQPEAPTESRELALLGVELRDFASTASDSQEPAVKLELLAGELRRIADAVRLSSGQIESSAGHRVLAAFEGANRVERALAAASKIMRRPNNNPRPAIAIDAGLTVSGTVIWGERPSYAITGDRVERLEALLRAIKAGGLALSSSAHRALTSALRKSGVELQQRTSPIAKLPVFLLNAQTAELVAQSDNQQTRVRVTTSQPHHAVTLSALQVAPGRLLGDRFDILSTLGTGGMGVVYKARDRKLDELVALKMLKPAAWSDPTQLERLKSEIKLARRIRHPNVLSTFDFGEIDGVPFISMEYVRGITLRQLIDQAGALPLTAGLRLARHISLGLGAAHQQGVVHRDMKPENLILEPNGNAKLMDFGIAKPLGNVDVRQTQPGSLVGTPVYLAPEQVEGKEADARADIYASGVVLYEIFTGQLPFATGGSLMEVLRRKLDEEPTPPEEAWPDIPPLLSALLRRCLARQPENRYRDANELLAALDQLRE